MQRETIDPINFAFVMATAIISITLHLLGYKGASNFFFFLGTLGFSALLVLFGIHFSLATRKHLRELARVELLFKYFTFSAAASGLAVLFCIADYTVVGASLAIVGAASAILLSYTAFNSLIFAQKASITIVSPYWLLMAIATNYVGITITSFWNQGAIDNPIFLVISFCFWTFGVTIYLLFMSLNLFRMFFMRFEGRDINPSYWTCIGAAAIAVVDGSNLITVIHPAPFLTLITPFIEGAIIFLWGWATAWFPILLMMEVWKYTHFKAPIAYDPSLWAIVFPLAMYTAATDLVAHSLELPTIYSLVPIMLWISLVSWAVVSALALSKFLHIRGSR